MKPATLLILMLSNQGYWFGGQDGVVEVRWAVQGELPAADLAWELLFADIRVGGGQVAMKPDGSASLKIRPPQVRVRTHLKLVCRAVARDGGKELVRAEAEISVFPTNLLEGLQQAVGERQIGVLGGDEDLLKALDRAKVPHTRFQDVSALQMQKADIILVAADQLELGPLLQQPLLEQACSGASVFVFAQNRAERVAGYPLAIRALPPRMQWRTDHPLFYDLDAEDLASWLRGLKSARAIQLPPNEPALEIAFWPRESPGDVPAPIDALVLSRAIGKGRLSLCQIPLGPYDADPRSQILLRNVISYLLSRPEPTLPPGQRHRKKDSGAVTPMSAVIVSLGGKL